MLLVEDNATNARLVEAMLSRVEDQTFQIQCAETLLDALNSLTREIYDVAVIDLTLPDSSGLETFRTIQRHAPALPILILTSLEDESMALSAVQQGAQDFLVKGSINRASLIRALNYAMARSQTPSEGANPFQEKGTVLCFLGSSGGVGTTTLATHCAVELAQAGERVLLVDLDISSAGASFLLKATASQSTLLDAVYSLHRLDASLWEGIVCSELEGIDLLQAPGAVGIRDAPNPDRVRHVLRFARSLYRWIVVDLGRLTTSSLAILEETQDLFVVTTPHLSSLYEVGKLLQRLLDAGFPKEAARLILNRKAKAMSISVEQVERALGYPFYGSISDDTAEMADAYAQGRFLSEKLLLRRQVAQLMRKWRGIEDKPAPRSGLGLLRFAKTIAGD
jgi:Flp pilus assembly CpaE family ATPase